MQVSNYMYMYKSDYKWKMGILSKSCIRIPFQTHHKYDKYEINTAHVHKTKVDKNDSSNLTLTFNSDGKILEIDKILH